MPQLSRFFGISGRSRFGLVRFRIFRKLIVSLRFGSVSYAFLVLMGSDPPWSCHTSCHTPVPFGRHDNSMAGCRLVRIHPVSKTRFPLRRFSPGAGLLRNPFFHRSLRFSRVWVRKDGNLVMETGCIRHKAMCARARASVPHARLPVCARARLHVNTYIYIYTYICIYIYIYIYIYIHMPARATLRAHGPGGPEILRPCPARVRLIFRNFIVFFWAETLAH